jgi:hypothetical protein
MVIDKAVSTSRVKWRGVIINNKLRHCNWAWEVLEVGVDAGGCIPEHLKKKGGGYFQ